MVDHKGQKEEAVKQMQALKIGIRSMGQAVETLSGGQRQGVAVARAAAWASPMSGSKGPLSISSGSQIESNPSRSRSSTN